MERPGGPIIVALTQLLHAPIHVPMTVHAC